MIFIDQHFLVKTMLKKIKFININNPADVFTMGSNFIEIGREKSCDLIVENSHDAVSRKHGSVTYKDHKLIYRHLGVNMPLLNGNPNMDTSFELKNGDMFSLTDEGPIYKVNIVEIEEKKKKNYFIYLFITSLVITAIIILIYFIK